MNIVKESLVCRAASRKLFLRFTPTETQRRLRSVADAKMSYEDQLRPEIILSKSNRDNCVKNIKLYRPAKSRSNEDETTATKTLNKAAVLVPLCLHNGELGLLYTLRSTKLNTNRGQVSFPGGMYDENLDKTLEETAVRETYEELGIKREKIDVWQSGNPMGRNNISVYPVFGYIGHVELNELRLNVDEVEEAFVLSLRNLCDPTKCRFTQFRDSFTLPTYLAGKHRVWGLTAAITHVIMKALAPNVYKNKLTFSQSVIDKTKIVTSSNNDKNNSISIP